VDGKHILLVEDDDDDETLLKLALSRNGMAVPLTVARDGREALDFLEGKGRFAGRRPDDPPALILLDLKMPKVGGLEVVRQVRRSPATRAVPVVILTSSNEPQDIEQAYALGANSYLLKPVDLASLVELVRDLGRYWLHHNVLPTPGRDPGG